MQHYDMIVDGVNLGRQDGEVEVDGRSRTWTSVELEAKQANRTDFHDLPQGNPERAVIFTVQPTPPDLVRWRFRAFLRLSGLVGTYDGTVAALLESGEIGDQIRGEQAANATLFVFHETLELANALRPDGAPEFVAADLLPAWMAAHDLPDVA
jgi:hypothetical protein